MTFFLRVSTLDWKEVEWDPFDTNLHGEQPLVPIDSLEIAEFNIFYCMYHYFSSRLNPPKVLAIDENKAWNEDARLEVKTDESFTTVDWDEEKGLDINSTMASF